MALSPCYLVTALLAVFLVLSGHRPFCQAAGIGSSERRKFDQFVLEVMRHGGIQSLSVSLVAEGDVFYEHGYEPGEHLPAGQTKHGTNKDSVFCLGGSTQAFTSVLMAILLARNENYTMESPVHEITDSTYHLPGQFRTQMVSLKDILGMRTGLSNMDIVATAMGMDRYRLMRNLRFAPEVSQFRQQDVYSEVLFSLVEDAARALGNESWYKLMRQHIFNPLGMSTAGFVHMDAQGNSKVAPPYLMFSGKHYQVPWDAFKGQELVAAATSVCASATDMSKWMHFILSGGKNLDNRQVVSEDVIKSTLQAVQSRGNGANPRKSGFTQPTIQVSYTRQSNALGWIKGQYRGYSFVSQDGSLPGYESLTTILPSRQVGAFTAFTGQVGGKAYAAKILINIYALDLLLHGQPWLEAESVSGTMDKMAKLTDDADSVATSQYPRPSDANIEDDPVRDLEEYAGTYRNYAFGDVVVSHNESENGMLRLHYGQFGDYILRPSKQNDTFIMRAAQGPLWYSTHADEYRKRDHLALFSNRHQDPSLRVETVLIPHFARDVDPEFSKNPTPPREDHDQCSAALPPAASPFLTAAALFSVLRLLC